MVSGESTRNMQDIQYYNFYTLRLYSDASQMCNFAFNKIIHIIEQHDFLENKNLHILGRALTEIDVPVIKNVVNL